LFPFNEATYISRINGTLEVTLRKGRKELNTEHCNYSYGYLQMVLEVGLKKIGLDVNIHKILVLGMGAGSIVETIRSHFKSPAEIFLVEIDPEIILIAEKEFDIHRFRDLTIIEADAFEFVSQTRDRFDMVVVDIFLQDKVPELFYSREFLGEVVSLLNPNGRILFNTMRKTMSEKTRDQIKLDLLDLGMQCEILEKVKGANDLFLGTKSNT